MSLIAHDPLTMSQLETVLREVRTLVRRLEQHDPETRGQIWRVLCATLGAVRGDSDSVERRLIVAYLRMHSAEPVGVTAAAIERGEHRVCS